MEIEVFDLAKFGLQLHWHSPFCQNKTSKKQGFFFFLFIGQDVFQCRQVVYVQSLVSLKCNLWSLDCKFLKCHYLDYIGLFYFGSELVILVAKVYLWQRHVELFWLYFFINYSSTRKQIVRALSYPDSESKEMGVRWKNPGSVLCPQLPTTEGIRNGIVLGEQSGRGVLGMRAALQTDVSTLTSLCGQLQHFQCCFPCNFCKPVTLLIGTGRQTKTRRKAAVHCCGQWQTGV